jgi:hypothetical protein
MNSLLVQQQWHVSLTRRGMRTGIGLKAVPKVQVVQHRNEVKKDDDEQGAKWINDAQHNRGL